MFGRAKIPGNPHLGLPHVQPRVRFIAVFFAVCEGVLACGSLVCGCRSVVSCGGRGGGTCYIAGILRENDENGYITLGGYGDGV